MTAVNLAVTLRSVEGDTDNRPDPANVLRGREPWEHLIGRFGIRQWYWATGKVLGLDIYPYGTAYLRHNWAMLVEPNTQSLWYSQAWDWLREFSDGEQEGINAEVQNAQKLIVHKIVHLLYSRSPDLFPAQIADVFRRGEYPLGSVECVSSPLASSTASTARASRVSSRAEAGKVKRKRRPSTPSEATPNE